MRQSIDVPSYDPLFVRIAVGCIFLSEGIQKFLFPESLGAGRFAKIGFPYAEVLGPLIGTIEVICGLSVLLGLWTRLAVVPLFCIMLVAIFSTKIVELPEKGFWEVAHGARTDFSMLLSTLFLFISGPGTISLDHRKR